ncbi:MAG TPA: response regulator transcription factor [Puia sp.]|jgi:DNA-binding NarL/FixJ family response regulator|nr:response regulator transcription factor [Puia sp.]
MTAGVLIYEDNNQLRDSIEKLITFSKDFLLLGAFPNVTDVEKQVKKFQPDVILMDIDMPGGIDGIDAVRKIREFNTAAQIIMLTVFDDSRTVLDAISSGASGYLLKKNLSEKLFDAINEVLSGGAPMSPNVARMVIASMQKKPLAEDNKYQLTTREREILLALSQGTSYKGIAEQFFISLDTVRSHIKNIYQKMQVHKQLEAITKARNEGIVP